MSSSQPQNFSGTSENGDFTEALAIAIQAAKDGLRAELVVWEMRSVSGRNGGIVQVNELTVTIAANYP